MNARQAVIIEPFKVEVREVELPRAGAEPDPRRRPRSAPSAPAPSWPSTPARTSGSRTRTCPTGSSPSAPATAPPARSSRSAPDVTGWKPGDRVSYPGNHASAELLTLGHERGRLWKLPAEPRRREGGLALHRPLRPGRVDPRRPHAGPVGGGAGPGHHRPVRAALPAGGRGASGRRHRRASRCAATRPWPPAPITSSTRPPATSASSSATFLGTRGAEIVADATGVPDAIPAAMSLACDGGQVVVVGSPRGKAKDVNFYDDLHRRYIEVTGAHGNMLFEPAHTRLAGAWDINKAQTLAAGRAGRRPAQPRRAGHAPHHAGGARHGLRGAAEEEGRVPRRRDRVE